MSKNEGPDVVVGDVVHWFSGGRTDIAPNAAIVTLVNFGGMLNLSVINQDGFSQHRVGVFQVGHQTLKDNPSLAARNGAWQFRRPVKESPNPMANVTTGSVEPPEQPPFEGSKPPLKKKDVAQAASV